MIFYHFLLNCYYSYCHNCYSNSHNYNCLILEPLQPSVKIRLYYIHLDLSDPVVLGAITQPSSVVLERANLLAVVVGHGVGDGLELGVDPVLLDVRQKVGFLHEERGPLLGVGGLKDDLAQSGAQHRAHETGSHHSQTGSREGIHTKEDVCLFKIQLGLGNEAPGHDRRGDSGENGGHKVDLASSGSQLQKSLPCERNRGGSGKSFGHVTHGGPHEGGSGQSDPASQHLK